MKKILLLSLITFFLLVSSAHALSFYPIRFSVWAGEAILSDNSAEIPLYIQNLGLLSDSYSINTSTPKEYSGNVMIETPSSETAKLKTNDVENVKLRMTISSDTAPVKILVFSDTAPIIRYLEVDIKPKPSYQVFYLAAIVLLAIITLLL